MALRGIISAVLWVGFWFIAIIATVGLAVFPLGLTLFLIFAGSQGRETKAFAQLGSTLMREEQLVESTLQKRIFALWHRRLAIGVTNSRIILIKRGLFGGFTMQDIQWKDLTDATLSQNILPHLCGSNIAFRYGPNGNGLIDTPGIEHDTASQIYAHSQEEEQAWEEKRRVRGMEEARARSGGVYLNTAPIGPAQSQSAPTLPAQSASTQSGMVADIERAKALLDSGIISDVEFQEMKSKIISAV